MNSETLRHIFKAPFDYKTYCNEIVHRLFGCNDVAIHPELLPTNSEGDKSYFIGQMDDTEGRLLGFFYTRVAEGSDVRRKRVGLRKLIQPYLNRDVDGAIAIFDDGRHWRLSYICDLKEGSTSAKRFSYIMGDENGQYKTPLERLEKIARLNGHIKLSDLKESFSVDALSDEFFDEYHDHYDRIVAELERQRKTGPLYHDYVKKLMGRIVFLYFLQKKGWLCEDTNFMYNTFLDSNRQNDYLESVLEPLFFGILNTEPAKRDQVFVKNGWQQGLAGKWASIPYLNGGLFERDAIDNLKIVLPESIFRNLFSFLASYNFTVDENDPDDAEIGVDPEMLGKIFESLLEDNKAKGAFYTPKEIVRYMCKESLIAHLASKLPDVSDAVIRAFVETHEMQPELELYRDMLSTALREVKICDPAIGSGAFPMGLLNELWRCREALGTQESRLQLKKEIIENNIYGVDIERGAIDIARLRFWLSIVVDSEEPQPLPNFDYKFMQGNSLIESYGGYDLSRIAGKTVGRPSTSTQLVIGLDSDLSRKNLHRLLREYFSVTDHQRKATMRSAINEEVKTLIRESVGGTPAFLSKLSALDPSANQEFFLWHTWFKDIFEGGGFDIVIGNPPYIQLQADGGLLADLYSPFGYSSYDRRGDIYELFYEKGNRILRNNGVLCFITSNGWMKSQYGDNLRCYLASNTNPILLIDFNQMRLFDNAVVETNILMFKKESNRYQCQACSFLNHEKQTVLADLTSNVEKESSICRFEKTGSWTIAEHSEQTIKNKIERIGLLIKNWNVVIYRGITTGCNAGFIIDGTTRERIYNEASENERRLLDKTIFPILQGRNLKKYSYMFNDKYMIVTPRGYQINNTPALKSYMLTHYDELYCKSGSNLWYELQASPSETMLRNMHKEKIMWGEISDKAKFTYDEGNYFAEATTFIMTTDDKNVSLKYLLAVLNSALSEWYFHKIATTTGMGTNRWKKYKLEQLPVVKPNKEKEAQIVELVDQILEKKSANPNANTLVLEQEIDKKVYELYALGSEEIAVIEQSRL
ncbi:MAG: Eco57I restriction-modification methylase domain-containing protein [Bacteroidales bacterium]|nr:Eco57I restriction-modification methylase domain-containing protein [Bacteroidales bacterium]